MYARSETKVVAQVGVVCPSCLVVVQVPMPNCVTEVRGTGVLDVTVTGQVEHVCGSTRGESR